MKQVTYSIESQMTPLVLFSIKLKKAYPPYCFFDVIKKKNNWHSFGKVSSLMTPYGYSFFGVHLIEATIYDSARISWYKTVEGTFSTVDGTYRKYLWYNTVTNKIVDNTKGTIFNIIYDDTRGVIINKIVDNTYGNIFNKTQRFESFGTCRFTNFSLEERDLQ